jgi:thiazole synthase
MNITLNREPVELSHLPNQEPTVQGLMQERGLPHKSVVVAVNDEVLRRDEWTTRRIREGDSVEIIHAVAGGAPRELREDTLEIAGERFSSRIFLGTGKYPDNATMKAALDASGTEMVTVAIRYMNLDSGVDKESSVLSEIDLSRYRLLPNTAGAFDVAGAVKMARLAREVTGTEWLKLEVIGDQGTLWPDTAATVEATRILVDEGFVVLPYTSPDLVAALRLEEAGAATVMPLGSPIGSGQGMPDWESIRRIVERISVPVVVDAGIGTASEAALAMELGADAVLVNTAIAHADDPVSMAEAMHRGTEAGRLSRLSGRMPASPTAIPSSPTEGVPAGTKSGS